MHILFPMYQSIEFKKKKTQQKTQKSEHKVIQEIILTKSYKR
jgi:hypothetical protein